MIQIAGVPVINGGGRLLKSSDDPLARTMLLVGFLAVAAAAFLPVAQSVTYTPLSPPSYPLAVKNPYLNGAHP
jgi:hypothetical protein